jgi:hypothetical protein
MGDSGEDGDSSFEWMLLPEHIQAECSFISSSRRSRF